MLYCTRFIQKVSDLPVTCHQNYPEVSDVSKTILKPVTCHQNYLATSDMSPKLLWSQWHVTKTTLKPVTCHQNYLEDSDMSPKLPWSQWHVSALHLWRVQVRHRFKASVCSWRQCAAHVPETKQDMQMPVLWTVTSYSSGAQPSYHKGSTHIIVNRFTGCHVKK